MDFSFFGFKQVCRWQRETNYFLLLETENLKVMQNMCLVVCSQILFFEKQFSRNESKIGVVFL